MHIFQWHQKYRKQSKEHCNTLLPIQIHSTNNNIKIIAVLCIHPIWIRHISNKLWNYWIKENIHTHTIEQIMSFDPWTKKKLFIPFLHEINPYKLMWWWFVHETDFLNENFDWLHLRNWKSSDSRQTILYWWVNEDISNLIFTHFSRSIKKREMS